jgi:hypothetical protein
VSALPWNSFSLALGHALALHIYLLPVFPLPLVLERSSTSNRLPEEHETPIHPQFFHRRQILSLPLFFPNPEGDYLEPGSNFPALEGTY